MWTTSPRRSRGNAIVVAVFVLVVLAGLGAVIATISSRHQVGAAYDIEGARAYQAARLGSEWGVYQVLRVDTADSDSSSFPYRCRRTAYTAASGNQVNLSGLAGSLADFTVTITCGSASYSEGNDNLWTYQITANACNRPDQGVCPNTTGAGVGGLGYVERRVSLTITN